MRNITMYTGAGGMELLDEIMEKEWTGRTRIYIGKKVLRILRRLKPPIKKSPYTGRYYKTIGGKSIKLDRYTYTTVKFIP